MNESLSLSSFPFRSQLTKGWNGGYKMSFNPFFTKPENEKLWNIPDDVFNVLDSIWDTGLEYDLEKIFKIIYVP